MRIGILGGSFNPAHPGHLYISTQAIKRLGLNQVWWLISPQNPLKPAKGMAPYRERLDSARNIAKANYKIKVSDFERRYNTRYSYDTVKRLKAKYPGYEFVFLIGADNLLEIHRWHRWKDLFNIIPIAVFDRGDCFYPALYGKAATCFAKYRKYRGISYKKPPLPAWIFYRIPRLLISSTAIREKLAVKLTNLVNSAIKIGIG